MFMTKTMKEAINEAYERGRKAGIAEKSVEAFEDEKRRNEQLYAWAYNQGAQDALAKQGIIDLDEIKEACKELGIEL